MKLRGAGGFLIAIGVVIIIYYLVTSAAPSGPQVCFDGLCLETEVVETQEDRSRGLMFRESLGERVGMLFIFEKSGIYSFWMKNTLIPLDIIWIDEEMRIVRIVNVEPCVEDPCTTYNPGVEARYVFETNIGFAEENGIGIGDSVEFKEFK